MKIVFKEPNQKVNAAKDMANGLLQNPAFYRAISEHPGFDLSTATPIIIAQTIKNSNLDFKIELFYPNILQSIRYRKTLAFTDSRFPNTLFLNQKKLGRSTESIAATIIHESIHALDDADDNYTYGHGNNSSRGKENTAPYWIGNLAFKMLTNNPEAVIMSFDVIEG